MWFAIVMIVFLGVAVGALAIIADHQQKLAKIRATSSGTTNEELQALRGELRDLKNVVHDQAILIDDLRQARTFEAIEVRDRLNS